MLQDEAKRVRKDIKRMKKEAPWLFNGASNIGGIIESPADSSFPCRASGGGGVDKNVGGVLGTSGVSR